MNARLCVIDGRIVTNDQRPFDRNNDRDWIGRESGYADFADDHVFDSRSTLLQGVNNHVMHFQQATCCNGGPPSYNIGPPSYNAVPPSCNAVSPICCSVGPPFCDAAQTSYHIDPSSRHVAVASCNNIAATPCNNIAATQCNMAATPCNNIAAVQCNMAATPCNNIAAAPCNIGQTSCNVAPPLSMQCTQIVTSNATTSGRCHNNGPIDVEDMALYFDTDNKSSTSCSAQVLQPSNRARVKYGPCVTYKQGHLEDERQSCASLGSNDWYDAPTNSPYINFCPEERWLQCPASDRCPLYTEPYVYDSNVAPPCLYENLDATNIGGWSYAYSDDGQFLEDYL